MLRLPCRWDLFRRLQGKVVLDVGGVGNPDKDALHARMYADAWKGINRTTLDACKAADIVADLNGDLPELKQRFDVVVLFDVLEHLKYPAKVMEWIKSDEAWLCFPNATSFLTQNAEFNVMPHGDGVEHVCSWNYITASNFLRQCGWDILGWSYLYDFHSVKGALLSTLLGCSNSLAMYFANGIFFKCKRKP